jgi:hypothetical protein
MKNISLIIIICLAFIASIFSQETPQKVDILNNDEVSNLNKEIVTLFQQGKFEDAIADARKVVELEEFSKDLNKIAVAKLTLGILKVRFIDAMRNDKSITKEVYYDKLRTVYAYSVEFIAVIDIYERQLKTDSVHLATAKFELARYYQEYQFPLTETEKLYLSAISIREKLLGKNNDATLAAISYLADYYLKNAEFEKASVRFEDCIVRAEESNNKVKLATGLRGKAQILNIVGEKEEFETTLKKLADLSASLPKLEEINLIGRTKSKNSAGTEYVIITGRISTGVPANSDLINQPHISDVVQRTDPRTGTVSYYDPRPINRDSSTATDIIQTQGRSTIVNYNNKTLTIVLKISIDENGKVVNVIPPNFGDFEKLKKTVVEKVMKMKFNPIIYAGKPRKINGYIHFYYYL